MKEVKLYNSLTDSLEIFKPLQEGKVSMYVCGPTVYGFVHIGNMRPVVAFDVLKRFLTYIGYDVTYVSNITDVDDKIIMAAQKEKISEVELTKKYTDFFFDCEDQIHAQRPNHTPHVIDTMDKIIAFIADLIQQGYAYVIHGDVYFRVSKIKEYGQLSNLSLDEIKVGARVEENTDKESPLDFTLWKKTDVGIQWDSPWSKGRPGWHTECVVMINDYFENGRIDIHGGGFDLKFPHHENEIAQSRALHKHPIANYWMHNGFVNIDNEKMSKSLGNVRLAKDFLQTYGGNVVRLTLLSTHYRAPINFTDEVMETSKIEFTKIETAIRTSQVQLQLHDFDEANGEIKKTELETFLDALADDLNTSNAITTIFALVKELNLALRKKQYSEVASYVKTLKIMLDIMGFVIEKVQLTEEDRLLFAKWDQAKLAKDYQQADTIRSVFISKKYL